MTTPNYEEMYNDLLETLAANGLDVAELQKGDERTVYRTAADLTALLDYLNAKNASATAAVKTKAYRIRDTI